MQAVRTSTIIKIFEEKGVNDICECCGKNNWLLLGNVATLAIQTSDKPGLLSFPIVAVECSNCGNVRFFKRDRLGLKDDTE